ncbi:MAG TPA: TolC family protein, partial [Steroidobacteraceae bacterium]
MRVPIVVMMALLAAGCAGRKSGPPAEAAIPPKSTWRDADQTGEAIATQWWESFSDAALTRTVATALAQNDDIAVAVTRVSQARAQLRLARAEMLPSVALVSQGGRDRDVNPGFGIPELQTAGEGEFQASYDLDLFGRLSSATSAARASLLATRAARDSVRLAVAASAANGYITLRSLDARLEVLRETLTARANELNIARHRAEIGYSSQLDLTQAQSEYDATEALIPATELAIAREENRLSVLLGSSPHAIERGTPFEGLANPSIPPLVPAEVLRRRPDIAAAEQTLAATDHSLDSARAA